MGGEGNYSVYLLAYVNSNNIYYSVIKTHIDEVLRGGKDTLLEKPVTEYGTGDSLNM